MELPHKIIFPSPFCRCHPSRTLDSHLNENQWYQFEVYQHTHIYIRKSTWNRPGFLNEIFITSCFPRETKRINILSRYLEWFRKYGSRPLYENSGKFQKYTTDFKHLYIFRKIINGATKFNTPRTPTKNLCLKSKTYNNRFWTDWRAIFFSFFCLIL